MRRVKINDIPGDKKISKEEMKKVCGGGTEEPVRYEIDNASCEFAFGTLKKTKK